MKKSIKILFIIILFLLVSKITEASSLYLPINSRMSELVEKMSLLTNMPSAKKPYPLELIFKYAEGIRDSHPILYEEIEKEFIRLYGNTMNRERITLSLRGSNNTAKPIPNSHGLSTDSPYFIEATYFYKPGRHIQLSLDGSLYQKNNNPKIAANNTYIATGWDYLQFDIGYRDHWFDPFYDSSMLISTNAINSPSITISNPLPIPLLNTNYEVFLSYLEETDGILYNGERISGHPRLLGMHLDFHPLRWFEIGLNRTFQFGGGDRPGKSLDDIWNAFIDPVRYDNLAGTDEQFGNQEASITFAANIIFLKSFPFKLYHTIAAEDTRELKNTSFSSNAYVYGVYFPYITKKMGLRIEHSFRDHNWYVHNLYNNGYRNDGNSMGHWVGDTVKKNSSYDNMAGDTVFSMLTWQEKADRKFSLYYRYIDNYYLYNSKIIRDDNYKAANEIGIIYVKDAKDREYGIELYGGRTPLGNDFYLASIFMNLL